MEELSSSEALHKTTKPKQNVRVRNYNFKQNVRVRKKSDLLYITQNKSKPFLFDFMLCV